MGRDSEPAAGLLTEDAVPPDVGGASAPAAGPPPSGGPAEAVPGRTGAVAGAASLGLATVAARGVGFVSQMILARKLAESDFGLFAYAVGIVALSGTLANLDARRDVTRVPGQAARRARAYAIAQGGIAAALTAVLFLAAPAGAQALGRPGAAPFLQALALLPLLDSARLALTALAEARGQFRALARLDGFAAFLQAGAAIGLAYGGAGAWALVGGFYVGSVVRTLGVAALGGRELLRVRCTRDDLRSVLRFGGPLLAAGLLTAWYWRIDDILVGTVLGFTAGGLYAVAFEIPRALLQVTDNLSRVGLSLLGHHGERERRARVFEVTHRVTFALLAPPLLVSVFHAEVLLELAFGSKWMPAAPALVAFLLLALLRGSTRHWADVASAEGRPRLLTAAALAVAVAMPVTGWFGMHAMGVTGMALGVVAAWAIPAPFYLIWTWRRLDLEPLRMLVPETIALVAGLGVGLAASLLSTDAGTAVRVVVMTGQVIVFAAVLFALDRELAGLFREAARHVLGRSR